MLNVVDCGLWPRTDSSVISARAIAFATGTNTAVAKMADHWHTGREIKKNRAHAISDGEGKALPPLDWENIAGHEAQFSPRTLRMPTPSPNRKVGQCPPPMRSW